MAGIGIIGLRRLVERVADPHPGAADELLLDQPRIERAAEFVGAVHPDHRHFAGLVVDLDLGDQAGMGVAGRRRHLAGLGIDGGERHQEDAAPGDRLALLELRGDRDVLGRDRSVRRALDVDVAAAVGFEIGGVDFELLGRRLHHHAARLLRRRHHGVADAMGAARGERAHAVRPGVGIGGVDIDVLDGHAERLGADLPGHRLHALAEIDRRQRHRELAARIGMHQRLAGIAAEIHADGIIDRRHAASAMPGHAHRLLVPKTEENRVAPCDGAGGAGGGGGGGAGGRRRLAAARLRRAVVRRALLRCQRAAASAASRGVGGTAARAPPPSLRDDMRLNSSRSGHLAFSAATCTHSISAVFFASRRCAFMSPSR